jgi:cation transport ATPase
MPWPISTSGKREVVEMKKSEMAIATLGLLAVVLGFVGGYRVWDTNPQAGLSLVLVAAVLVVISVALAFWQEGLRKPVLMMEALMLLGVVVFILLSIFGAVGKSWTMMILGWVIGPAIVLAGLYLGRRSAEKEKALEKEVRKELGAQDELGELIKGKTARVVLVVYLFSLIPFLSVCMLLNIPQAVFIFLAQFFAIMTSYDMALWYYYRKRYG